MPANALPPITEAAFQRQVIQLAKLLNWRAYHTLDSRGSAAGFPDLVLVRKGRLIFCELKSQTGRVRTEQVDWMTDLIEVAQSSPRVEVYLWRPADLDEIAGVLR